MTNIITGDSQGALNNGMEYTAGKLGGAIVDKVIPGPNPDLSPQVQEAVHIVNETIKNVVEDKSKNIVKEKFNQTNKTE